MTLSHSHANTDSSLALSVGCLAYFDSFAGLVPCWIMSMTGPSGTPSTAQRVVVKFTAKRGPYRRGETLETFGLHVLPRGAARRGKHSTTIRPYTFV
jgi:hypothetical protein